MTFDPKVVAERQGQRLAAMSNNDPHARAEAEVDLTATLAAYRELDSWNGHIAWLHVHYPPDVVTGESGDPGPVNVVLIRRIAELEAKNERLVKTTASRIYKDWRSLQQRAEKAEREVERLKAGL